MRPQQHIFPAMLLAGCGLAAAAPLVSRASSAADLILAIMPTSGSCDGAQFPNECRTASQASPFLIKSLSNFTVGEIAAMLALIGLESADMKFKHNVSPGRPGQGTSNMMSPNFVNEYAISIFGSSAVAGKSPDEVLALVTPDDYNFGSAPWFYQTKCGADVHSALKSGSDAGWAAYMGCIGVDPADAARLQYWNRAKTAFGL
ncbi:hypothetical protein B0T19DRAFT_70478 [Cercophora scortea]|uniref:Uncharacterized protein n=1 Tax=Cercophora scortea TaxID=314031 RepID=A0AAE0J6D4_9PEZI|nr:hypothetical protein B0T19DRAFT_70478 [Cercophora scortea]